MPVRTPLLGCLCDGISFTVRINGWDVLWEMQRGLNIECGVRGRGRGVGPVGVAL
jgi:hypothetical protein